MNTWEIRIQGIVQGVGFRPKVYQLAHQMGIKGEVSNGVEGLLIRLNETAENSRSFYQEVLEKAPSLARITQHDIVPIAPQFFETFQIVESESQGTKTLWFTPDYGLCESCKEELQDPKNRRYGYPFITCTQCGPRFSIIRNLPYDRPLTTMAPFAMCDACLEEYHDPTNRRHFSQTNSCPDCGIDLVLESEAGPLTDLSEEEIRVQIHQAWEAGKILALKGIGGYLLTCDARNADAVQLLRTRKHRPTKPLAVMYPSWSSLAHYQVPDKARDLLLGEVAPIVLLEKSEQASLALGIADGLREVGIMLPYAPLFAWLFQGKDYPIVATSGNLHKAPIIYQDDQRHALLAYADLLLHHNREILIPEDDSVARFSPRHEQQIILRRSRGWAPSFFAPNLPLPDQHVLAAGADMKASFGLLHEGNLYLSQYLGALSQYDSQENYREVMAHTQSVLGHRPAAVVHDLHPNYASSRIAQELASQWQVPTFAFQHHKAHFAAILAEHALLDELDPILGVIWDGTGWGEDGQIWGGEFFLYQDRQIQRHKHFSYFPILGGDKMAREPRLSALSLAIDSQSVRKKFTAQELKIFDQLHQKKRIQTSSLGRLFDAVASILGLSDQQHFEGEAAMKLEALAHEALTAADYSLKPYPLSSLDGSEWIRMIVRQMEAEEEPGIIAARFHMSLAQAVWQVAKNLNISKIVFSGGVFQNGLLVDAMHDLPGQEFTCLFHRQLSPNDENIALGQLILYLLATSKL